MGKIISTVAGGIDDAVNGIVSTVTNVGATAAQLATLASNFAVPAPLKENLALRQGYAVGMHKAASKSMILGDDPQDIGPLIKSTLKAALAKSQSVFTATYVGDTGVRSDNGLVQNYCGTGGGAEPGQPAVDAAIAQLKAQLAQNFNNWQFPTDDTMMSSMAQTMVLEVFNKAGAGDSSVGTYSISTNQSIDWTLTYGLFSVSVSPSTQALVYAFSAAFNSGF